MNVTLVILLSSLTLILPAISILWLLRARAGSRAARFLTPAIAASVVLFAFLAGTWGFFSYYLRFIMAALFIIALYKYLSKTRKNVRVKAGGLGTALGPLVLILFIVLNALVIKGYFHDGDPVELSFPLKSGTYYVIQGGNSTVTNIFHSLYKTINAVDIVKLDKYGNRADGISPDSLSSYAIYGDTIYSPCDGIVVRAVDGLPDLSPHEVDAKKPAGNHVVIECKGVNILIAHMMNGSVLVKEGDIVKAGREIGRVGNSGNTFEPHLHIHAVRGDRASLRGKSVPILFDGRFLSLNSLVESNTK